MIFKISKDIKFSNLYRKLNIGSGLFIIFSLIILFFMGSGPVKGFAVTLGIGILTTLFSAYFFARHLSSSYAMKNKDKQIVL